MSAPDDQTTLTTDSAALAGELFAPGVGAQAGPPSSPADATGVAPCECGLPLNPPVSGLRISDATVVGELNPRPLPSAAR